MVIADAWRARFEAFAERKRRLAEQAVLPPYVTDADAPDRDLVSIGNAWSEHLFDGPFYLSPLHDRRLTCSLVFVQSADGNTVAADPSTLGGGETDKHLIYEGLSRVAADGVLAGAETIRGADLIFSVWHPEMVALRQALGLPRHPVQIAATRRGIDVEATLLFNVPDIPVVVIATRTAANAMREALHARTWVHLLVIEDGNLRAAVAGLHALGINRVSCVGGRALAASLSAARLVDELYLTTSPRPGGEPNTPVCARLLGRRLIVCKRGTGVETGVVFEHWRGLKPAPHGSGG